MNASNENPEKRLQRTLRNTRITIVLCAVAFPVLYCIKPAPVGYVICSALLGAILCPLVLKHIARPKDTTGILIILLLIVGRQIINSIFPTGHLAGTEEWIFFAQGLWLLFGMLSLFVLIARRVVRTKGGSGM